VQEGLGAAPRARPLDPLANPSAADDIGWAGRRIALEGGLMFRVLLVVLAVMVTAPAMAKVTFPVTVPQECAELAQRGIPS
jgi:hypothetical protein